jgi:hypothetical protein
MIFIYILGDFLDEFYKSTPETQAETLHEKPEDIAKPELMPFLAATARKLANDYGMTPPRWAFDKRYYLPGMEPHFGCRAKGDSRLLFMYKLPSEFKRRNLFADENALVRV